MIHESFDIERWKQVFSLAHLREEVGKERLQQQGGGIISQPYEIALIEQLREESFAHLPNIERVPADIFIWKCGEPDQRATTKLGGLPYRQAGKPWPVTPSDVPMNFVAQSDLIKKLPAIFRGFFEKRENFCYVHRYLTFWI